MARGVVVEIDFGVGVDVDADVAEEEGGIWLLRTRRIWVRAKKRTAPKESPVKTIFEAGTGSCRESGGG
jgi:hypothetical protein